MAKKSRTPPPPRRVQAPRQRRAEAPEGRRRRLLLIVAGLVAVAAIAGGAVVAWVALGGGSADEALVAAGCTIEKQPAQGQEHVEQLPEDFEYNTFPPTTGPHSPIQAIWDVYTEPIEQSRLVHNLEHGGVIVQYGEDVPESTVTEIRDWYLDDPNGIIVAPLPELDDKIALTAWWTPDPAPGEEPGPGQGVVATCPSFDSGAFGEFKDTYGFRGPERFPRDSLQPGT